MEKSISTISCWKESQPTFSVIVPVRDDLCYLKRTLPKIYSAVREYEKAELIIVDNGSRDGSDDWLAKHYADRARLFRIPEGSIGAVRNFGARKGQGDILCFVDADCVVEADHLEKAKRTLKSTAAAAVGARYSLPQNSTWVETTWHHLHRTGREEYVAFLSAGNFIIRSDIFEEVGGFDEDLVTGEDAELCQRIRDSGYWLYHDPQLKAVHLGNAKTLIGFFRKQRWYALGMMGTVKLGSVDKPVLATVVHGMLLVFALVLPWATSGSLILWGANVVIAATIVPVISTVYRWCQIGKIVFPLRSLVLYEVFFIARLTSIVLVLFNRESGWRPVKEEKV